ncbi:aromatic acid exporter family protein [Gordonia sp. TBRC 11910]|uniref:Aromatic acid exporter family protein n=1 Tax=Gordonia asplenii TaxID=2725283 RepID=A0A848L3J1_9ACTN|nr:aromatic acid exporter family protein [Gordonia asplenii]
MRPRLHAWFLTFPAILQTRLRRLWLSGGPILQCAVAAGLAWWVASMVTGTNPAPFFAPIAAVVSLGLSLGKRWRRSVELVGGVVIGILVGDLLVRQIGSGTWQVVVVVALAMATAVFLDDGPLVPMQAASSATLVATLLPPGGTAGFSRAVDALIGGVIGLIVVAVFPVNPAHRARRDAAGVLTTMRDAAWRLADGLRNADEDEVFGALEDARATQGAITQMRADMGGGQEVSRISPLYWRSRERLERISETADPIDNAVRNFRVLSRRALSMVERGEQLSEEVIEIISDFGYAFDILRAMMMADPGDFPDQSDAAKVVRRIGRRAKRSLADEASMAETATVAQIRSIIVDMFMICGLKRTSALAQLR